VASWPGGDAVPQVGSPPDDVALDKRHPRPDRGNVGAASCRPVPHRMPRPAAHGEANSRFSLGDEGGASERPDPDRGCRPVGLAAAARLAALSRRHTPSRRTASIQKPSRTCPSGCRSRPCNPRAFDSMGSSTASWTRAVRISHAVMRSGGQVLVACVLDDIDKQPLSVRLISPEHEAIPGRTWTPSASTSSRAFASRTLPPTCTSSPCPLSAGGRDDRARTL